MALIKKGQRPDMNEERDRFQMNLIDDIAVRRVAATRLFAPLFEAEAPFQRKLGRRGST